MLLLALPSLLSALFVPGATFQEVVATLNRGGRNASSTDPFEPPLGKLQKVRLLTKLFNELRVLLDDYEAAGHLRLLYERVLMLLSEPSKIRVSVKKNDSRSKMSVDQSKLIRTSDLFNQAPAPETFNLVPLAAFAATKPAGPNTTLANSSKAELYTEVMTAAVRAQGIRGYLRSLLTEAQQPAGYKTDKYYDGGYDYPCEDSYETAVDDDNDSTNDDDGYDYTRRKFVTWAAVGNTLYPRRPSNSSSLSNSSIDALGNVNAIQNGASRSHLASLLVLVAAMLLWA